jgi:hypothetical protein
MSCLSFPFIACLKKAVLLLVICRDLACFCPGFLLGIYVASALISVDAAHLIRTRYERAP